MAKPIWEVTEQRIKEVESYAAHGLMMFQIADALGISKQTLNEKRKSHPELSDALKRGKAKGIAHYASLLMKKAESGSVPSIIFFLKTKGGFIEKSQVKHTHDLENKEKYENRRKAGKACQIPTKDK